MACARLDIPSVIVTGGYMPHCFWRGEDIGLVRVSSTVGKVVEGSYPKEDFQDMMECAHMGCGACGSMTTASSMCFIAEALGMTMPGNASINATDKRLGTIGYEAGRQVMRLFNEGITARQILTEKSHRKRDHHRHRRGRFHQPAAAYSCHCIRSWDGS